MKSQTWQQLKDVFNAALDRPPAERAAFLENACGTNQELRAQVDALLASHETGFMETPPVAAFSHSDDLIGADEEHGRDSVQPGDLLDGKYRIERPLGHGGMGAVYLAEHVALRRRFAVKVIHREHLNIPSFVERFRIEAQALGRLKHPNIVDVTDFGIDAANSRPYLVMEYLEGSTLAGELSQRGPLSLPEAMAVFVAIAAAMDYAHGCGVLHRDLKPANVVLWRNDSGETGVKILDFGVARLVERTTGRGSGQGGPGARTGEQPEAGSTVTQAGSLIGTAAYMPPEVLSNGTVSRASDIYSFGVLIYEALTGRLPFDGSIDEMLAGHRTRLPVPPSQIRPELAPVLDAAILAPLQKNPLDRPSSGLETVKRVQAGRELAESDAWRAGEIPRRLRVSVIVALCVGLLSPWLSETDFVQRVEGRTLDARFSAAPVRSPDSRILLVVVDDATLAADSTSLPAKADEFGRLLDRVFQAGASGVAIDFLLPESWSRSYPFAQFVMRHADRLTLAALSTPTGVIGPECITGVTAISLGPVRAASLFGFVNTDPDPDGVHRSARTRYIDTSGGARPSLAARAASTLSSAGDLLVGAGSRFWIDHTVDRSRFARLSWNELAGTLEADPQRFRDRLVLVGGQFAGSGDETLVPGRDAGPVPGVVLQALALDTILKGFPLRDLSPYVSFALATIAAGLIAVVVLVVRRVTAISAATLVLSAAYITAAFVLFASGLVLPVAGVLIAIILALVIGGMIRVTLPPFPQWGASGRRSSSQTQAATTILRSRA